MASYQAIFTELKKILGTFNPEEREELQADLDVFKESNLKALEKLTQQCDGVDFLVRPVGVAHLQQAEKESKKITPDNMSFVQAQGLMKAIDVKLQHELRRETVASLNSDLFSTLKAAGNLDSETLDGIYHVETEWQSRKPFAALAPDGIALMEARLNALSMYVTILESGAQEVESMPALASELKVVAADLKKLIADDLSRLKQAKLARLDFVPREEREKLLEKELSKDQQAVFHADVCAATLRSLKGLGLSSSYVDTFDRFTTKQELKQQEARQYGRALENEMLRAKTLVDDLPSESRPKSHAQVTPERVTTLLQQAAKLEELKEASKTGALTPEQRGDLIKLYKSVDVPAFLQQTTTFDPVPRFMSSPGAAALFSKEANGLDSSALLDKRKQMLEGAKPSQSPKLFSRETEVESKQDFKKERINYAIDTLKLYGERTHDHNRKERVDHVLKLLKEALKELKESDKLGIESDTYNNVIAKLFMHYQSIDDSRDDLSQLIESALCRMLGLSGEDNQPVDFRAFEEAVRETSKKREEISGKGDEQSPHMKLALYKSTDVSIKKFDPMFVFLRKHIIEHEPTLRDKLFEQREEGAEYNLKKETAEVIVGQLEEMDRLEEVFFKGSYMSSASFDYILSGAQALPAKGFKHDTRGESK